VRPIEVVGAERLSARLLPNILGHTPREIRVCFLPLLRSDHGHCTAPRRCPCIHESGRTRSDSVAANAGPSIHAVPRKARLSASLTGMLSETGVPVRLWRAPVPERRLSERVYSAMSSRIVSI
jgi:hypothetical protein